MTSDCEPHISYKDEGNNLNTDGPKKHINKKFLKDWQWPFVSTAWNKAKESHVDR